MVVKGKMNCELYQSAFSGEVVFSVRTASGESYEGVAPKHYAEPAGGLTSEPTAGQVSVKVLKNGGGTARVIVPDGEAIEVPGDSVK